LINLPAVTEPEAVEQALQFVLHSHPNNGHGFDALLSLGSENFIVYELTRAGTITGIRTGNKCGSGTGEFFLQQLRRMDVPLSDASNLARSADPYSVCGRCSVFCKSDCTHALNKGIPVDRVLAGLGNMIADKVLEILGALPRRNIIAVGGVTKNDYVMDQLRQKITNLYVPAEAEVFEALGAAICAARHKSGKPKQFHFAARHSTFGALEPLQHARHLVTFREHTGGEARDDDETVLGLDVGSTTTKATLVRTSDNQVLASVYLRTNGNPIRASRECYRAIHQQLGGTQVHILGLGVTGSGRHISGLHAQSKGVINEIIAHATAAAFYDPDVDTIFEIGGQDAKYTYLVNGVPCDYAMNEACSAGTGSFLEEAARESLNIDYLEIQDIALRADAPPNFNDQCAAFISSDIKNASHDVSRDNIVAGLVYSICMNYSNRVKGSRKVGNKIFMQGGVCYNRAVPLAMASLLQREIVVPPDPGLMGALGVALEVKQRMEMGLLEPDSFDLCELADREVQYGKTFHCPGTSERCDRGCDINIIKLDGKSFPFGGACNKYYNVAHDLKIDPTPYDFVARRQQRLFECEPTRAVAPDALTVGMSRSFLVNLLYPLYAEFFGQLGIRLLMPDEVDPEGMKRINAPFCFPAVISHGMMSSLLKQEPDYLFLPHVHELHVEDSQSRLPGHQCTCITALAEPYYLKSAFPEIETPILSPQLNFAEGWEAMEETFVELAQDLGRTASEGVAAYDLACRKLKTFFAARQQLGRQALEEIEKDPDRVGIVLFGRPYNAFAADANMGIPQKFASRGVLIVPFDCLPFHQESSTVDMNWAMGQDLTRAAQYVKKHPQLFGTFVTNFGCGPDSFLLGYFRDTMQTKPSLTLEIDSHTADAGINTRVEAFLDIVDRYRRLKIRDPEIKPFRKAQLVLDRGKPKFRDSQGREHSLYDSRVKVVLPSMGRTNSEAASAVFQGLGIRSQAVPHPDYKTLLSGRCHTCCKECLPLILSVGSLIEYLEHTREDGELLLYFMPSTNGNCRFPQYSVFFDRLIEKNQLEDVAIYTLTSENGYSGLGTKAVSRILNGVVVADAMDDVKNAMSVLASDPAQASEAFNVAWQEILDCLSTGGKRLYKVLHRVANRLARVPRRADIDDVKHVLLAGEIFVRKDEFSSQRVVDALAEKGIIVQRAPVLEWIQYIDYWVQHMDKRKLSLSDQLEIRLRMLIMNRVEKRIKKALSQSGFYRYDVAGIESVLEAGERFVDRRFGGETNLVIGRFMKDMLSEFHGLISIGPFACMPTRIIDSILTPEAKRMDHYVDPRNQHARVNLPFLSIETDGNPFPQTIEAQLEAFCLQVQRTPHNGHSYLKSGRAETKKAVTES
jgi:predicted CoA-substrate-specific enzyme activase